MKKQQIPVKSGYVFQGLLALLVVALVSLGGYVFYGVSHAAAAPTDQFTLKDISSGRSVTATTSNGTQVLATTKGDSLTISNYQSANVTGGCASYGILPWGGTYTGNAAPRSKNVSVAGPNLPASATASAPATIGLELDCTSSSGSHYASRINFTVNLVPTLPPPAPAPSPSPTPKRTTTHTTSPAPAPAPAGADTIAPSVPGSFTATLDSNVVNLSWAASTDNVGVTGYKLERSLDQTVWVSLGDSLTATSFSDTTAGYGTTYYYRLSALDAAGNASGYATTQISTGNFQPNISGQTTVTSDDGLVSVSIPPGAFTDQADCSIATDSNHADKLPLKGVALVSGPYSLICKKASGDTINTFNTPVSISLKLTAAQAKRYHHFNFYSYNTGGDNWTKFKYTFNKRAKTYNFTTGSVLEFAVLGSIKKGLSAQVIILVIMLILLIAGVAYYLYQRAQKQSYQEYIRKKYYNL